MKVSEIRKVIQEVLTEMSTTGDAGGYLTKYAFSKKGQGKNVATKTAEKLGYKTVERLKRPSDTKMFTYLDENK